MTTSTTFSATAVKLAEMMTENTGRSLLDSGDAYGRAWERNAGMTAGDFLARPTALVDGSDISLDMFHYLNERLTYAPELTSAWESFDAERPNDSWYETMSEWLDSLGVESDGDFYSDARFEFNSYNFDNILNGTIQGVKFGLNGSWYVALQIHGGCDVRGGYTRYAIYTGDIESLILDMNRADLVCPECDFRASFDAGELTYVEMPVIKSNPDMLIEVDAETQLPKDWELEHGCPIHKTPLVG